MTVRASADPDEMPPTRSSDSNMLRIVPFNAPFECVRTAPAVRVNAALSVVDLMKATPLVDSGSPTMTMIYLSQKKVGTVAHIRNGYSC
jgi:hypothetical protein